MIIKTLNELREATKSESSYRECNLHDFCYDPSGDRMTLNGSTLSTLAAKQLLGIIHTDKRFAYRVSHDDPEVWRDVYDKLKGLYDTDLTVKVNDHDKTVEGVFRRNHGFVTNVNFVDVIESVVGSVEGSELSYVEFYNNKIVAHISPPKEVSFGDNDDMLFKVGQVISNSSVLEVRPAVSDSLMRLMCSNMTYITARSHIRRFKTYEVAGDYLLESLKGRAIAGMVNPGLAEFYKEKIVKMKSTNLSLREVVSYSTQLKIHRDNDNEPIITDVDTRLPSLRIKAAYGLTDDDEVTSKWMMTARTPINAYDVFDYVTTIATHNESLNSSTRIDLQVLSGRMMFADWDLDNVAPRIDFDKFNF